MNNLFSFSNSELEFLDSIGIEFKDNIFFNCNTNKLLNYVGSKDEVIDEAVSESGYDKECSTYNFEGEDGTIKVIRVKDRYTGFMPNIIAKFKDFEILYCEKKHNAIFPGVSIEKTREVTKILDTIINISIRVKLASKDNYALMNFIPNGAEQSFSISYLSNAENRECRISGYLHGLTRQINYDKLPPIKEEYYVLDSDEYKTLLEKTIDEVSNNNQELANIFSKFIPMFVNIYDATLRIPAINAQYFRNNFQNAKDYLNERLSYALKIVQEDKKEDLKSECNRILKKILFDEKTIEKLIEMYPVNGTKQK